MAKIRMNRRCQLRAAEATRVKAREREETRRKHSPDAQRQRAARHEPVLETAPKAWSRAEYIVEGLLIPARKAA